MQRFRNHLDIRFSRPARATMDDSVQALLQRETQWQVGYLPKVVILHYGYQLGAIASRDKLNLAKVADHLSVRSLSTPRTLHQRLGIYLKLEVKIGTIQLTIFI